jgi:prophage regulatory protein
MANQLKAALAVKQETQSPRLIRLAQVMDMTGMGRSWIYVHAKSGDFPKPIRMKGGQRCPAVVWVESEVDAYIQSVIASR